MPRITMKEVVKSERRRKDFLIAVGFLAPNFTGFLVFVAFPVAFSLVMAFTNWTMIEQVPLKFMGLANFKDFLTDEKFWYYFYNTAFLMIGLPITMFCSLLLAAVLSEELRFRGLFRSLYYVPSLVSGVALLVLFKNLFNPEFGPINETLRWFFGLLHIDVEPPAWFLSMTWAKPALVTMGIWMGIGGHNLILYLAAISNVPPELHEAAAIDGSGWWSRLRHVIWPQVAPTTFYIIVMGVIGGLQGGFEQARVLTSGGPFGAHGGATTTLSYFIYNKGFVEYQLGYAAAVSWVLFIFIFGITIFNWKFGSQYVNE